MSGKVGGAGDGENPVGGAVSGVPPSFLGGLAKRDFLPWSVIAQGNLPVVELPKSSLNDD